MMYSKSFHKIIYHGDDIFNGKYVSGIGEQIAEFCNEHGITKNQIVACEIFHTCGREFHAELIWQEVE